MNDPTIATSQPNPASISNRSVLLSTSDRDLPARTYPSLFPVKYETTVVSYFTGKSEGYVLAGRSLSEVERRTERLLMLAGFGWLVAIVGSFIATLLFVNAPKKK